MLFVQKESTYIILSVKSKVICQAQSSYIKKDYVTS